MPFYEYQCKNCGHDLEAMQKFSDRPLKKCPQCGKSQLKRLMSAPVFRLKGSGWYETDFKSDKESQRNLAGAEPAEPKAEAKAAPETKTGADDKSAAKSEASAAPADKAKSESAAPQAKEAPKTTTASRSVSAKRATKRSAPRPSRKSARSTARAGRRR